MQLCSKIQDIGAEMSLYDCVSYLTLVISHEQGEQYYTSADFVPNITSLNVILYNSSVNKLILYYIRTYYL